MGAHVESERVSQCRDGLHELLRERFGATRLAHYAAGGFNLAIEDARELRQAFGRGGAGGRKIPETRDHGERHGFFYARRLDIVGLTLRNIGIGTANCALKWAISSGESAVCMGRAMKKRSVKQN